MALIETENSKFYDYLLIFIWLWAMNIFKKYVFGGWESVREREPKHISSLTYHEQKIDWFSCAAKRENNVYHSKALGKN